MGPTSFTGVQSSSYWSSGVREFNASSAFYVNLGFAFVVFDGKAVAFLVWPVRGGH